MCLQNTVPFGIFLSIKCIPRCLLCGPPPPGPTLFAASMHLGIFPPQLSVHVAALHCSGLKILGFYGRWEFAFVLILLLLGEKTRWGEGLLQLFKTPMVLHLRAQILWAPCPRTARDRFHPSIPGKVRNARAPLMDSGCPCCLSGARLRALPGHSAARVHLHTGVPYGAPARRSPTCSQTG